MTVDLLFSQTPATSGALVFGGDTAGPVSKDATLALSAYLPGLGGAVRLGQAGDRLTLVGTLPTLTGQVLLKTNATNSTAFTARLPSLVGTFALTVQGVSRLTMAGTFPSLSGEVPLTVSLPTLLLLSGGLPELSGVIPFSQVRPAYLAFSGSFPGLSGTMGMAYDNQVTNWLDSRVKASHQPADPASTGSVSAWTGTTPHRDAVSPQWQTARPDQHENESGFFVSLAQRLDAASTWTPADPVEAQFNATHQQAEFHEVVVETDWQVAVRRQLEMLCRLQTGIFHAPEYAGRWQDAVSQVRNQQGRSGASLQHRGKSNTFMPWQVAGQAKNGLSILPLPVIVLAPCYIPSAELLFSEAYTNGMEMLFVCERHTLVPPVIPGAVAVPVLRTYVTINSIVLRRIDGNVPIPLHAFGMSLDADSWTWSWSASIPLAALALVQPGNDGAPVEVEAMVNGVPYRLCAEGISSQRQFAQGRIAVKGRGLAAVLDAPYAPVGNHGNTAARTAQQLMADVLSVNGVGFGWAVDWALTDWLVPGNTWTHHGAYISAILDIAKAAGGYVQPHDTDQALRILPRYPSAPWNWASVTPDFELPSAVVSVEGIDWTRKADYDRVFVSGIQNGVLGQVTRAGTAGASVAPMVTDPLITQAIAARQRGLAILSDTGNQARVSLTLPVLAETGLIKPGQFVRYQDGAGSRLGLVRSTSLVWSRPKLRQTIAVETHA
ncbi:hypothetical protein [Polaromonas sp. CG_23.6]|uniref:hypothetical protein n=1 Tax=Polaromonas sp. CG_23.6 TaxID=2760709 RepID=UPI0024771F87|nr:hypothetical protein [Polaromonas sp. CG_23.6]MDH6185290.1 hypothetical protein [Polaromonas sp. CG_23.6]